MVLGSMSLSDIVPNFMDPYDRVARLYPGLRLLLPVAVTSVCLYGSTAALYLCNVRFTAASSEHVPSAMRLWPGARRRGGTGLSRGPASTRRHAAPGFRYRVSTGRLR